MTNIRTNSKIRLTGMALAKFVPGLMILCLLLFLSAGTFDYWNVWLLLGVLIIPMLFIFVYLINRDPELLRKRLNTSEKEKKQKKVVTLTLFIFLTEFIICGLDHRFQWTSVPLWLEISSSVIVLLGYFLFFVVIRQNSYASRVVEIQNSQKVIDTGLYSIVRHPMYLATILMFLFMPLLLGSFYGFLLMLMFPVQMNSRIKNEEEVLEKGLEGYSGYKKRVRYKVVPYIW